MSDFRVTLLGTGVPIPSPSRFGPSTLVEAGGRRVLIDAGRGASIRLYQLGIPMGSLDALLLTHFHSDHTVGIPDIWLTGWLSSHFARRVTALRVIGPVGTATLMHHLQCAYAADVTIRIADELLPPEGAAVTVEEFSSDGVIYDRDGLRITAFEVDHGDVIKPAYGYRIDHGGRAAVISGDTRLNENVVRYGTGVDLLVHEVATAPPALMSRPHIQRIMAHHVTPQEAGTVFARARPRLAAYTHLVFLADEATPSSSVDDLIRQTRETYDGPLQVGEDLMRFEIGDSVRVVPFAPQP